jgi:ubiquinone/menaquinone biosynthesis C-methylase UbiE
MTDDLAATNRARWNALVEANVEYSRPMLDLTPDTARTLLDPMGLMGDVTGKEVLCLASGGGQQSAAFALLGANVTVFDLSDKQLERDREAAAHYGVTIRTVHGDMRHLNAFADASFDLVYHAFSINFVPAVEPVLAEVARVSRPGALYRIQWHNPFTQLIEPTQDWTGSGYQLRYEYVNGREATELFPTWTVDEADGSKRELESPREFVHSLSTMINTLVQNGFVILRAAEYVGDGRDAAPGSWWHYMRVAAPYLTIWARHLPGFLTLQSPSR